MEGEIRLVVVDDHLIVRMGISNLLKGTEGICLVGEADCGKAAIQAARALRPDVMLLDIKLPDMSGIEVIRNLKSDPETSHVQVVILTVYDDIEIASEAIRAGAMGYILKDLSRKELLDAIRAAHMGTPLVSDSVARKLVSTLFRTERLPGAPLGPEKGERAEEEQPGLTEREYEVLRLVAKGYSNKTVARELSISLSTVKTHLRHIFQKLGVEDRAQLIIKAIKEGII
ncbi:MAG: response regulator transcription factor [Actinobacteria bacterium]|nr:response regulator transcription factor [Actinomycetota bacterium]